MSSAPVTSATSADPPDRSRLPWRSAALGWAVFGIVLVAGVPLFLRMPVWIDVTLYDVAARTVLRGGVHYRDVFDTNPPGFVWVLSAIRAVLGPGMEVLRAVDLVIVSGVVAILLRWARAGGATAGGVAWTAAGIAGFYLFLSEFNHCQRDVWMMLPALAAAWYRVRRVRRAAGRSDGWVFRTAVLEGTTWGLAAWVKPHIILVAAAAWLVTQGRLAGSAGPGVGGKLRRSAADLAGAFAGGLLVGAAGLTWLVGSGTWPYMYEVFTEWNPAYLGRILQWDGFETRLEVELRYFPPWSVLLLVGIPVAVLDVLDARLWAGTDTAAHGPVGRVLPGVLHDRRAGPDARFARGALAAVFLAWAVVTIALQNHFHYAHVPETLLMLALFAANRWALAVPAGLVYAGVIAWVSARGPVPVPHDEWLNTVYWHVMWQKPDGGPNRFRWWPGCFARTVPGELRNGVGFHADASVGIDWAELAEVEAYLRAQGVQPGDDTVICWHDSPHALYLTMNLRPPIRFMHLSTAVGMGDRAYEQVKAEVTAAAPGVKFAVSDLRRVALFFPPEAQARMSEPGPKPDLLPPVVPPSSRKVFPLNQPTVFRSGNDRGRYLVHRVENPVGEVYVPVGFDLR